jgi:hypothetical protein
MTHMLIPAAAAALLFTLAAPLHADLSRALAEPNLEKRSRLALENAKAAYQSMRAAYDKGETGKVTAGITEIGESVELAHTSLKQTGKAPRKSPKYFKEAEIATRDLLRRLQSAQDAMSFDDRPSLDPLKKKVQQIHEDLLIGLMEGKRK